jgi:hypothetical protein
VFDYVRSHSSPSAESLNFGRRTVDADIFIGRAQSDVLVGIPVHAGGEVVLDAAAHGARFEVDGAVAQSRRRRCSTARTGPTASRRPTAASTPCSAASRSGTAEAVDLGQDVLRLEPERAVLPGRLEPDPADALGVAHRPRPPASPTRRGCRRTRRRCCISASPAASGRCRRRRSPSSGCRHGCRSPSRSCAPARRRRRASAR